MNKSGSGSRITDDVRTAIYKVWKAYNEELSKAPGLKFSIKELLNRVNKVIIDRRLRRTRISRATIYEAIKKFEENIQQMDPRLDKPFDLATFSKAYAGRFDAGAIHYIFNVLRVRFMEYERDNVEMSPLTNRQALWIAKLYQFVDSNIFKSDPVEHPNQLNPDVEVIVQILNLDGISKTYEMCEAMYDTIGKPFDSSKLDYALAKDDLDEWKKALNFYIEDSEFVSLSVDRIFKTHLNNSKGGK